MKSLKYDFDKILNRRNTNCVKYDFFAEHGYPEDTIPMWVADMDFPSPNEVTERLREVVSHRTFGYSDTKSGYFKALHDWFTRRHGFETRPEWLIKTSGVICAVAAGVRAFTEKGDGVLIQRPVYGAFEHVIKNNGRKLNDNALINDNGRYSLDFGHFESIIKNNGIKLFILCSPHNPVGRVWTREELKHLGEICLKYGVIIISDEIHCDFIYNGFKFISMASISPEIAQNSVICTAPSKTFNLAGLNTANVFVPNEKLRTKIEHEIYAAGAGEHNIFGMAACEAAYSFGGEWLDQLIPYLQKNVETVSGYISENLPGIRLTKPEGTYLTWLDFSGLNRSDEELNDILKHKARLWLSYGGIFGPEGKRFQRMNIACPGPILCEALLRLKQALKS